MIHLRAWTVAAVCVTTLSLTACGGGDYGGDPGPPPTFTTQILSDSRFDGDIEQTSPNSFVVTQGMSDTVQSIFAGIDPVAQTEFRAFLDFPLTGSGGVPGNARIDSAFLEFYVNNLQPQNGTLPLRIDLVAFQPPTLLGTDFDPNAQPALASVIVKPDISAQDVGTFVPVDVTALMVEAQRRGLVDFQVRVMEDLGPAVYTLMEIDDSTGSDRSKRAPLLTVTYF